MAGFYDPITGVYTEVDEQTGAPIEQAAVPPPEAAAAPAGARPADAYETGPAPSAPAPVPGQPAGSTPPVNYEAQPGGVSVDPTYDYTPELASEPVPAPAATPSYFGAPASQSGNEQYTGRNEDQFGPSPYNISPGLGGVAPPAESVPTMTPDQIQNPFQISADQPVQSVGPLKPISSGKVQGQLASGTPGRPYRSPIIVDDLPRKNTGGEGSVAIPEVPLPGGDAVREFVFGPESAGADASADRSITGKSSTVTPAFDPNANIGPYGPVPEPSMKTSTGDYRTIQAEMAPTQPPQITSLGRNIMGDPGEEEAALQRRYEQRVYDKGEGAAGLKDSWISNAFDPTKVGDPSLEVSGGKGSSSAEPVTTRIADLLGPWAGGPLAWTRDELAKNPVTGSSGQYDTRTGEADPIGRAREMVEYRDTLPPMETPPKNWRGDVTPMSREAAQVKGNRQTLPTAGEVVPTPSEGVWNPGPGGYTDQALQDYVDSQNYGIPRDVSQKLLANGGPTTATKPRLDSRTASQIAASDATHTPSSETTMTPEQAAALGGNPFVLSEGEPIPAPPPAKDSSADLLEQANYWQAQLDNARLDREAQSRDVVGGTNESTSEGSGIDLSFLLNSGQYGQRQGEANPKDFIDPGSSGSTQNREEFLNNLRKLSEEGSGWIAQNVGTTANAEEPPNVAPVNWGAINGISFPTKNTFESDPIPGIFGEEPVASAAPAQRPGEWLDRAIKTSPGPAAAKSDVPEPAGVTFVNEGLGLPGDGDDKLRDAISTWQAEHDTQLHGTEDNKTFGVGWDDLGRVAGELGEKGKQAGDALGLNTPAGAMAGNDPRQRRPGTAFESGMRAAPGGSPSATGGKVITDPRSEVGTPVKQPGSTTTQDATGTPSGEPGKPGYTIPQGDGVSVVLGDDGVYRIQMPDKSLRDLTGTQAEKEAQISAARKEVGAGSGVQTVNQVVTQQGTGSVASNTIPGGTGGVGTSGTPFVTNSGAPTVDQVLSGNYGGGNYGGSSGGYRRSSSGGYSRSGGYSSKKKKSKKGGMFGEGFPFDRQDSPMRQQILATIAASMNKGKSKGKGKK